MFLSFAGTYIVPTKCLGIFFGKFSDKENEGKGWERNISVRTLAWTSGQLYGQAWAVGPGAWAWAARDDVWHVVRTGLVR